METNKDEQEAGGRGCDKESQGDSPRGREEHGNEWTRSRTSSSLCPSNLSLPSPPLVPALDREPNLIALILQFTFNPEWFEGSEEEEEEDWDLDRYRKQKEDEDEAAEVERIRQLQIDDGGGE